MSHRLHIFLLSVPYFSKCCILLWYHII